MADDSDIRWAEKNPCAEQREIENKVAELFLMCAAVPLAARDAVFVEGIALDAPCESEAAFLRVADVVFKSCRDWSAGFEIKKVPHSLFVIGCGPRNAAAFRIVAFDLEAMMRAAPGLGRALDAHHVLIAHSTVQAMGPDGEDSLSPANRLLVRQVAESGYDIDSLPWGYRQCLVARMFDGRTGRERSFAWMQPVEGDGPRTELPPSMFAPYHMVDTGTPAPPARTPAEA